MFQMDVLLTAAVVDDPEKLVPKLLQKKKKKRIHQVVPLFSDKYMHRNFRNPVTNKILLVHSCVFIAVSYYLATTISQC